MIVKSYPEEIIIYSGLEKICSHRRLRGKGGVRADIRHYLDTLMRKPGALTNAAALKCEHELKAAFDEHYREDPRGFIQILMDNKDKTIPEITIAIQAAVRDTTSFTSPPSLIGKNVLIHTRRGLASISDVFMRRGERIAS